MHLVAAQAAPIHLYGLEASSLCERCAPITKLYHSRYDFTGQRAIRPIASISIDSLRRAIERIGMIRSIFKEANKLGGLCLSRRRSPELQSSLHDALITASLKLLPLLNVRNGSKNTPYEGPLKYGREGVSIYAASEDSHKLMNHRNHSNGSVRSDSRLKIQNGL